MITMRAEIHVEEGGLVREGYDRDLNGELSLAELLEYTKASLILVSDQVLKEEQALGFPKKPIVVVDGSVSKAIADVSPIGTIEFVVKADVKEILMTTYKMILDKSPVLSGEYKAHHFVFWNGQQIATDLTSLKSWIDSGPEMTDKDLIRFVDIQPYARKLERLGVTAQSRHLPGRDRSRKSVSKRKGRGTRVRYNQPNGVYYLTNKAIRQKYRFNSTIRFEFITGSALGIVEGYDKVNRKFKTGRKKSQVGRAYLYPSILISVRADGVV